MRRYLPFLLALLALAPAAEDRGATELVVVVHADRAGLELSAAEISRIYLGRTTRWPDGTRIGARDHAVGSEIRDAFLARFLKMDEAKYRAHWSKLVFSGRGQPPVQVASDDAMLREVAADPSAIGYLDADTEIPAGVAEVEITQ